MAWKQLEPTAPHLTYLTLSTFLITYALFSSFIRNRLHLSEPPLATLVGIAFGPKGAGLLDPEGWGLGDDIVMEFVCLTLPFLAVCSGSRGQYRESSANLEI